MSRRSHVLAVAAALVLTLTVAGLIMALVTTLRGGGGGIASGGRIALLDVDGEIGSDTRFLKDLERFRRDGSIKGYVVAINSPGGAVGASQSMYGELRKLRRDGRPVVASIADVGASGGYYVALGADSIFALPGSLTGSIGVIMELPNAAALMRKVGVEMNVVKSAEHKDIGSPFRDMTPGDRALLDTLVSDVYGQFVDAVAQARRLPVGEVRALADGRVLSGRQALAHHLVDRTGNLNDAIAAAGRMAGLGSDPRVARVPEDRTSLLDLLVGRGAVDHLAALAKPVEAVTSPRLRYVIPW